MFSFTSEAIRFGKMLFLLFLLALCGKLSVSHQASDDFVNCRIGDENCRRCATQYRWNLLHKLKLNINCSASDQAVIESIPTGTPDTRLWLSTPSNCLIRFPANLCDFPGILAIDISQNKLEALPSFSCLHGLVILEASYNNIQVLESGVFVGLKHLRYLDLKHNDIHTIMPGVFTADLQGPLIVHLGYNKLTTAEAWPMMIQHEFCYFGINNNLITHLSNNDNWHLNMSVTYGPGYFDLSNNLISEWIGDGLREYGIYDLRSLGKFLAWGFDFRNNPFNCDCKFYDLLQLVSKFPAVIWRDYFKVYCHTPFHLRGKLIIDVKLDLLVCNLTDHCPAGCFCQDQPSKLRVLVDCEGVGLQELPLLLPQGKLHIVLRNNFISKLAPREYLSRTRILDISHNSLVSINSHAVSLLRLAQHINLSYNHLKHLPQTIRNLSPDSLSLNNNNLECHCNNTWLGRWLQLHKDQAGLTCALEDGRELSIIDVDDKFLGCRNQARFGSVNVVIVTFVVFVLLSLTLLIVFRYEMAVLFHTRFSVVRRVTGIQHTGHKNDTRGIFVSVDSESDSARIWVGHTLRPALETVEGQNVYIPFIHSTPGSVTMDENLHAMQRCRAAIIVVSKSYVEDTAKLFEFSEIYKAIVKQNCGHVCIVKFDNVVTSAVKSGHLRAFLRLKMFLRKEDEIVLEKITADMKCLPEPCRDLAPDVVPKSSKPDLV